MGAALVMMAGETADARPSCFRWSAPRSTRNDRFATAFSDTESVSSGSCSKSRYGLCTPVAEIQFQSRVFGPLVCVVFLRVCSG